MKTIRIFLPVLLLNFALAPSIALGGSRPGCTCGTGTGAESADKVLTAMTAVVSGDKEAPARHPLKGVVVEVMANRSALLVQHEEVPGVMKAMTMMLKVDEAALKSAKKGDAVTGMLVRKTDGWWLEDVKVSASSE